MKKIFAILLTVALFATNAVIVLANEYEDANEGYVFAYEEPDYEDVVFPELYDLGWLMWMPDWDREFDRLLDELIFRRFGEGSDFLFDYATEIGRTFTTARFEIEVVGSIAFEGSRWGMPLWDWHEDTGQYEETGEVTYLTDVESYVFIAIRDLRDELDMRSGVNLELAHEVQELGGFAFHRFSWANQVQVARESEWAYFAIQGTSAVEDVPRQVDISFTLEYFLADFVWHSDFAGIDFAALLARHEASFTAEDVYAYFDGEEPVLMEERFGFASPILAEVMGADFDPLSPDFEVMVLGELNVRLADGHYLTNIALADDVLLRIQLTEPPHAGRRGMAWTSVQLVDARVQAEQDALWEEWDASLIAWLDAGRDWEDFDDSRFFERARELEARLVQELFSISLTQWWDMDAPVVNETGFYVGDSQLLNHLDFMVHSSYYETHVPIPFSFSGNVPVLDFGAVEFAGTHRVFVHDRYLNLTELRVGLTAISFEVLDTAFLDDLFDEGRINVFDLFEIEFIMASGEVLQDLRFGSAGWSRTTQYFEGDRLDKSWFSFDFMVDPRGVVGVRINGTEIMSR